MGTAPNPLRRSQRSRSAILDAAMELCAELGYGKVTVEAVAARANVSKKTIYRWWPSKGAVVLEALHEWGQGAGTFPDTGDIVADLQVQMEVVTGFLTGPHGTAYIGLIAESQHDEQLARALTDQFIQPRVEVVVARLRIAQHKGQLSADADLPLLVERLYGPIHYRVLLRLGGYGRDSIRALIHDTLGPWLQARPAEPSRPE